MIFTITQLEKHRAKEESKTISPILAEQAPVLLKVVVSYFEKTAPQALVERLYELNALVSHADSTELLRLVFEQMSELAATETILMEQIYSTGDLAKFFGVSIQTIHNWIDSGRFIGVERREKNKQVRVAESTVWISPTGQKISVKDVMEMYKEHHSSNRELTRNEELQMLTSSIIFFEKKYGGRYAETLGRMIREGKTLSVEAERDAGEWRYLINQVGGE